MEYFKGSNLAEHLRKVKNMSETGVSRIIRQLVNALNYCHKKGICHLDVKPENILINQSLTIKLIDFAFAVSNSNHKIEKYCGTAKYMAPEILKKVPFYPEKADVWSVGVVAYRLFTGKPPFVGDNKEQILKSIQEYTIDEKPLDSATSSFHQFISKTLRRTPESRLSMEEVALVYISS